METKYVLHPSQWINYFWWLTPLFIMWVAPILGACLLIIPICVTIYTSCWKYKIYEDSICEKKGVFNVTEEYVHIFRIKSIKIEKPLWLRIVGLSVIHIISSEQYKPYLKLYGIENGDNVRIYLEEVTADERLKHGVKDADLFKSNDN